MMVTSSSGAIKWVGWEKPASPDIQETDGLVFDHLVKWYAIES